MNLKIIDYIINIVNQKTITTIFKSSFYCKIYFVNSQFKHKRMKILICNEKQVSNNNGFEKF